MATAQGKLELNRVHVIEKVPGQNVFRLTRTQPAIQFRQQDQVVWVQRGMLFDNGGEPIAAKNVPAWFAEEIKRADPRALAEAGYRAPEAPKGK